MRLRWARMSPALIDELTELPPQDAAHALRAALDSRSTEACCTDCGVRYEVHGDIARVQDEACPVCGGTLELGP